MNYRNKYKMSDGSSCRYYDYSYDTTNRPVQDGLNVTPSEMMRYASEGIPIAGSMNSMTEVIDDSPGFEVSAAYQRGADICSVWNAQASAREKLGKTVRDMVDRGNYGIAEGGNQ